MSLLIATTLSLAAVTFWYCRRDTRRTPAATAAGRGGRVCNPQLQGRQISRVWRLEANGCTCQAARQYAGRRVNVDDTIPLPFGGRLDCRCSWRPLGEARRGQRRHGSDRREQFRMELSRRDRRAIDERRDLRSVWGEKAH